MPGNLLTHWGQVMHICISKLTIVGSDNGLSPGRHQTIIWTNVGILLIGLLGTNFSEILITVHTFSWKKILLKISSAKWHPFCLGLNVLRLAVLTIRHQRYFRSDSRLAPSQWETALQSNAVSHWLGANLESALYLCVCDEAQLGLGCDCSRRIEGLNGGPFVHAANYLISPSTKWPPFRRQYFLMHFHEWKNLYFD